ncbi:MAG: site-specific DNA-methyltransferase [Nitrospiraceae bacterium]
MGEGIVPTDVWDYELSGTTDEGGLEVKALFGEAVFDHPKPTKVIKRMLSLATTNGSGDIVLDFFAGSGSTGHAVVDQNEQDGGNRRFVLVQLPEPTMRSDFPTITELCEERIRRIIQKLAEADAGKLDMDAGQKQERGFRVFKLAESNFSPWDAEAPKDAELLAKQLDLHIHHIRDGRTEQDLLFELLLKSGFPLTTPVEKLRLPPHPSPLPPGERDTSKTVYSVANGAMLICLERELTLDLVRAMADKKPERVVCLDEGFTGNDQLKANAVAK